MGKIIEYFTHSVALDDSNTHKLVAVCIRLYKIKSYKSQPICPHFWFIAIINNTAVIIPVPVFMSRCIFTSLDFEVELLGHIGTNLTL